MFFKIYLYGLFGVFIFINNSLFAQVDSIQKIKEVKIEIAAKRTSLRATQTVDSTSFLKTSSYNVADAIRNFAGVTIKDYGGIGGLKTVSVRSLGANHTGVQYDGINLGDAQTGQIDLGKLMLDNVASISLYQAQPDDLLTPARSFSSASLIVIKTREPSFDVGRTNKVMLKYTGGSFGLVNPVIQYDQKINKNWSFNLNSAIQKATGEYKYKVDGDGSDTLAIRKNSKINTLQLDGGILGRFSDKNSISFRVNYYDSKRGLPNAVIYYYDPEGRETLWNSDFYAQAKFKQKLSANWDLLVASKFSENYTRYYAVSLNQAGEVDNKYTQKEYYQSVATTFTPLKNLKFNYAADLFFTTLSTNLYQYAYPLRTSFLQVVGGKYKFKKFIFEANVLNTYVKEKVENGDSSPERMVFSPTLSLAYALSPTFTLRGFYKNIFRYPTFNDLYYTNFGNRNLNPETAIQYNAGIVFNKFNHNRFNLIYISTDIYYNKVKDKIISLPGSNLGEWKMYNINKVAIYGVDFTSKFNYQLSRKADLEATLNYTYQLGLDRTDSKMSTYNNQIPYTPQHTIAFNTGYQNKKWGVFYNHIFSSGRYYLGENKPAYFVKGFSIGDISANYKTLIYSKPLTLTAEINNLYNKNYSIIRSFPMPGTSIRLTIKTII